jgi:hypothetical protein
MTGTINGNVDFIQNIFEATCREMLGSDSRKLRGRFLQKLCDQLEGGRCPEFMDEKFSVALADLYIRRDVYLREGLPRPLSLLNSIFKSLSKHGFDKPFNAAFDHLNALDGKGNEFERESVREALNCFVDLRPELTEKLGETARFSVLTRLMPALPHLRAGA